MTEGQRLIRFFSPCFGDSFIDRFAAGKAFRSAVPVGDVLLSQFPAEQDYFTLHHAREIEETDIEVFDLYPGSVDFGYGILNTLKGLLSFRLTAGERNDLQEGATVQEYPVRDLL